MTKEDDIYVIEKMIIFAEDLGISHINFHDLFKAGVPMDTLTGNFAPTPEDWVLMYTEISKKITNNEFKIDVKLPQCFIEQTEFEQTQTYYRYYPRNLGEIVMF
ncbi:hypothetical protein CRV02_14730, partial [Arcobacter sp. CECT 8989]|uniref:hypothetical protein n=1 Tax=Arcobacter sp. CECT 8989 TaxID=2044509 RepID=UPI0010266E19